ncbi:6-phosphogluconolactonase [Sphingomonas sp. PP-CE-1A-559]|uniref:lactonase family protein n=1 Tax=Sphingomonas sp. PP-CE-1A-559 TaxID=2135657 RepID=UPI001056628D|nr:beta-propeller fold lactonase family protein [Sphingomonas sp. PP-CE-1A-559]TCP92421.1 6-phosphogluconolactonase [Sphingomonas sp. PP-CE-1A-559]
MTLPDPRPDFDTVRSLWIGTYAGGGGAGIYPLGRTGLLGAPYPDARNASFGTYSSRFDLHYLVDEQDNGALGVHRRTASGWVRLAHVPVGGAAPCHAALDRTQSCVAVANYASGSVSLFRLDPRSGLPIGQPTVHANDGSGPDPERQQSPHAHWVGFGLDNQFLYVADLGTDEVLAFAFDAERATLGEPHTALKAVPGSGPRHLFFQERHPRSAYLICELDSTLLALDVQGRDLKPRMSLSTLPAGWHGANIVAHIGANAAGDRLYVSNRGHDSIAVFAVNEGGDPTLLQHIASGGVSPRFFMVLEEENRMIVVHERDQRVTMLDILPDGTLAPTDFAVHVPGAAYAFVA